MNQGFSRALLFCVAVLLFLGLGFQGVGTGASVVAQEADCGPWLPYEVAEATPQAESEEQTAFQVLSQFETVDELSPDQMVNVFLTQVMLFDNESLAVLSGHGSIIRVDNGLVQITICEGSQVEIQEAGLDVPTRFGAGTFDVAAGGAIFVDPDDQYFITSASTGGADAEMSGTPIAATPAASDEARTGSTLTIVTWDGIPLLHALCGGAGC
jgi:hypothetical protein